MAEQETEEPSIEEILSSIRQIISDDDDEGEDDSAPAEEKVIDYSEEDESRDSALDLSAEEEQSRGSDLDLSAEEEESRDSALDLSAEEDVIELTEVVEEDEPEPELAQAPEPVEEMEVDLQDLEPEPEPEPEDETILTDDTNEDSESILGDNTKAAVLGGFETLARKTAIEHNGITVEEIVRSELNPLLRDWLDRNLPPIIERLVQEELEKISKRATEND